MPGEDVANAIDAAREFKQKNIITIFTQLGENISILSEAADVAEHYCTVLDKIADAKLRTSLSLKLTQLGLDLSQKHIIENFSKIAKKARESNNFIWIDMEDSSYTDITIQFYRDLREEFDNIGVCLQAYLYRTAADISDLGSSSAHIRLVKGAYMEPADLAFPKKKDVDRNYLRLAEQMLEAFTENQVFPVFATHDEKLIGNIIDKAVQIGLSIEDTQFNMLYGIKPGLQFRLAQEGLKIGVLISYGRAWFPWYMRRLAERPADLTFVL